MNDYIEDFRACMFDNGITPPAVMMADGTLHRFKIDGKSAGWYVLHGGDYWAGAFGDWSKDTKVKWKQNGKSASAITPEMRKNIAEQRDCRLRKEADDRVKAAHNAQHIWGNSLFVRSHPYAKKKGIPPLGARIDGNLLVIPIINAFGDIINLQFINEHGDKRFMKNGEKKGCFLELEGDTETILICEGYATGVSLYSKYYCTVIVAFDAGNLKPVAMTISSLYPESEIVIAADNDASGIGLKKALEACEAIGCGYIMPRVVGTDFNDEISGDCDDRQ